MKCPNCGCEIFYERKITTNGCCTEGGAWQPIIIGSFEMKGFICKKCGRVEIYCPEAPEAFEEQEEAEKKAIKAAKEKQNRINALVSKRDELLKIVSDENQTVKAVREAKSELEKIDRELENLQGKNGWSGNY